MCNKITLTYLILCILAICLSTANGFPSGRTRIAGDNYPALIRQRVAGKIGVEIKALEKYWLAGEDIIFQVKTWNKGDSALWVPAYKNYPLMSYAFFSYKNGDMMYGDVKCEYERGQDSILMRPHDTLNATFSAYVDAYMPDNGPRWVPGSAYIMANGVGTGRSDTFYLAARYVEKYVVTSQERGKANYYFWLNKVGGKYALYFTTSDSLNDYSTYYNRDTLNQASGRLINRIVLSDYSMEPLYIYAISCGRDSLFTYAIWNDLRSSGTIIRKITNKGHKQVKFKDIKSPVLLSKDNNIYIEYDRKTHKAVLTYQPAKRLWDFGKEQVKKRIEID